MNFLSHFYFERHCDDPDEVVGTVLPDLVKNARKDWNLHPERNEQNYSGPFHQSLYRGWKKHLAVDRYFHNSEFFFRHTRAIRTGIAPLLEHSVVRPSFLAHISLELMLDSLLLTENMIRTKDFYDHLNDCNMEALRSFLEMNGVDDISRFSKFYANFIEHQYLDSYRDAHQIMYALKRICMRVWPDPLNDTQVLQLNAVLMGYHEDLRSCFAEIFREIEAEIPC